LEKFFSIRIKYRYYDLDLVQVDKLKVIYKDFSQLGIGDWGLGIGDWAQSPIPNPQSPIPIIKLKITKRSI
jgi:hypothetical protein